jgi:TRAP-type mannitol/chloroaromatic compound transport system substrate-binding protein
MLGAEDVSMTRRSRHGHGRLAGAVVAVLVLLGAGVVSAQTVTWSMADEYPATSIQGEADARFAREVSRRTGGRIEIAHQYDASSGFRSREMVAAIGRGAVPLGNMYMGALGAVDPVFLLPSLPFLATTPEQGQALAAVARPHYERVLATHNQILLFQSPCPPASGPTSRSTPRRRCAASASAPPTPTGCSPSAPPGRCRWRSRSRTRCPS